MKIIKTEIPDVLLIEPKVFEDSRGFFLESYQAKKYAEVGISADFVQENHSSSKRVCCEDCTTKSATRRESLFEQ